MGTEKWNEYNLTEKPFPESKTPERKTNRETIIIRRLKQALKRINPEINENNIEKVVYDLTHITGNSLIEINENFHKYIINYLSIEQDLGQGRKHQTVKIIDFENPENNDFLVVNQFKVNGTKENIIPDIIVFINGIPLVVIECKSPTIINPIHDAINQLLRYQDLRSDSIIEGAEKLFYTNQIIVATANYSAKYATTASRARDFRAWKDPYPKKVSDLGKKPSAQEILIAGMFDKKNLLDLIQNFIVFERREGKIIKKLARYQQFRAVNKAIDRILNAKSLKERGGTVWHTQGSGKSLTMLWLAVKLRRITAFKNPTIVILTDRIDLDDQIETTFKNCKFPNPVKAKGTDDLREKLRGDLGQTITTTVQKFLNKKGEIKGKFPVLSKAENIFVLADEAHRTQYKLLATNMRTAIPNACFLGFTGTPLTKKEKSTAGKFGSYIDVYDIQQSISDEATVPIFYESRLPDVWIVKGESLDEIFERIFIEYSIKEKEAIKTRYATIKSIVEAPDRIEEICLDLLKHYEQFIEPNGFKAQIVTMSRDAAVTYKETIERLNGPETAVIMSGSPNDPIKLKQHHTTKDQQRKLIERFLKHRRDDKLSILIVCDMLLTGFDAPIEQVMYLDKPLKEHNLLQAIARVNRPYKHKNHGLIVDYFGISKLLEKALAIFDSVDIQGCLDDIKSELPRLEANHRKAMSFFTKVDINNLEECVTALELEDTRLQFEAAFKKFSNKMEMLMPDKVVNPYIRDLFELGKIRNAARLRYRDDKLNLQGCSAKVRKLIEDHIRASGVDPLGEPVDIFSGQFQKNVDKLTSDRARASEIEYAIKKAISVKFDENPSFYISLRKRLEDIIDSYKEERLAVSEVIIQLKELVTEARNIKSTAQSLGLDEDSFAIYGLLLDEIEQETEDENIQDLAPEIVDIIKKSTVIDWITKDDIQRRIRKQLKLILIKKKYPKDKVEPVIHRILELARIRFRR